MSALQDFLHGGNKHSPPYPVRNVYYTCTLPIHTPRVQFPMQKYYDLCHHTAHWLYYNNSIIPVHTDSDFLQDSTASSSGDTKYLPTNSMNN